MKNNGKIVHHFALVEKIFRIIIVICMAVPSALLNFQSVHAADNVAPALDPIDPQSVDELTELSFTATATDDGLPSATLTYSLSGEPEGAVITADGNFTWTPTEAQGPGTPSFDVCVSDGELQDCKTVSVTVNEVNVAPVMNDSGDKTVIEQTLLAFTATATDADVPANTLNFSLSGEPIGASITSGGDFTWTPSADQTGTYPFEICVSDGGTPVCDPITVTVNDNAPPELTAIGNKNVDEETELAFTATATDTDLPAQTLTFSLGAGAPSGAGITTGGDFTWTPAEDQGPDDHSIQVCVTDGIDDDCETITVTVNEVNTAPVINDSGNKTIIEQALLSFTATATDADIPVQTLTFSLSSAPTGANITNGGYFTWTPSASQVGIYPFNICVSDGGTPVCDPITVTVNDNAAPVMDTIGDKNVDELVELSFTATATDTDLPAQTLSYSLGGTPPTGANITIGGAFTWTPSESQGPGSYPVQVCVSDGIDSDCDPFTVTVNEVNVAPTLNPIGDKNIAELTELAFTATANDTDDPAQTLTFSLSGTVPEGANITGGGYFTWTPTDAQGPGSYPFDVCVSDGGTPVCEHITVTVSEENVAPVLDEIGNKNVNELTQLAFTATATDADIPAQSLSFSLGGTPPPGAAITSGGAFTWTPTEAQGPGSYPVQVCVSDGIDSDCETITVSVNEVNIAPVLVTIGDKSVDELVELAFTATATDADIPAQSLSYSLGGTPPSGASITLGGAFSWTPTEAQGYGSYPVQVCVNDGTLDDCETITVTVNEVNTPPTLNPIGNKSIQELDELSFTATAGDTDIPAATLTFSLSGEPAGAAIDPDTGVFTWTPTGDQGGDAYPFDVCVSDGELDDCETITVTVGDNTAPVLDDISDKNVNELAQLSFTATATDSDLPAQTLTFRLNGTPPDGASITQGGDFTWTPAEDQGPDDYLIEVCVSDGELEACDTFTVTVYEVNQAPVMDAIDDQSVDELTQLAFTATATDADLPTQTLTFSLSSAPEGASITPDGDFTWTPAEDQGPHANYFFIVCVADEYDLNDCESFTVTVREVNVAPVLDAIGDKSVDELTELSFTVTATDADIPAQNLTFQLSGTPPAGASITTGGVFSWTPTEAQGPEYEIYVCVSDGTLGNCDSFKVTVNEVNTAPVLDGIGDQSVNELAELAFTATAKDADLPPQPLTFSLGGTIPDGAAITAGGDFTWTPTEDQGPGDYPFDVCVSDGDLDDCETITVTVYEVNTAPVLDPIGNKNIVEETELAFTATASDADVPVQSLTFTLVDEPTGASITAGGDFTWTPTDAQGPGTPAFDVCVSDGVQITCETITVTVTEVNTAPVLDAIGDQSVDEQTELAFTATATDADIPAQTLTFSLSGIVPDGAAITAGGDFAWTPAEDQGPGDYPFDVCVSDGILDDCETITVTVNEVNAAPVLGALGELSISELIELAFTATATDEDIPAQTLEFSLSGTIPEGAAITPGGDFTWTPTEDQGPGPYAFDVCVSDGSLNDCEEITVTVNENNVAPVLDPIGNQNVDELAQLAFTATATDEDKPVQTLTFSLNGAPTGAAITAGGDFTWTPAEDQGPGTPSFDVCVSDGELDDCETITVTVAEINSQPVLDPIGNKQAKELFELTFTAAATDADLPANSLTYSLSGEPAGAAIDPDTGVFSWTPAADQGPADHQLTIEVCDDGIPVECDQEVITVSVSENHAPVAIDLSYETKENEGGSVPASLGLVHFASDEDGDSMTALLVSGASHGDLTLNSDGSFSYYPEANFSGNDSFVYKVHDGYEESNTATATIIVDPIPTKPPSTPELVSPSKNALLFDLTPRLDWKNSSLPSGTIFDHYQLQVARDSEFTDLVLDESIADITDSEYTFQTNLQTNMKYYWRVMAFNSNNSNWSDVRYFREAMVTPVLVAPENAEAVSSLRPLLDWEDVDGADSYQIQISKNSNMSSPFVKKSVAVSEYEHTSDLPLGRTLYWRVRAKGSNGPSEWSEIRSLVTPAPPTRPNLSSPANDALITDLTPRLDWSTSSLVSGTLFGYYQLQVATDEGFTAMVLDEQITNQLDSEYTPLTDLSPNTKYYWRVRALNSEGHYRSWSEVRSFREAMLPPVLEAPAAGELQDNLRPLLDWGDVDGADSYFIQVSKKSNLKYPFIKKTVSDSEYLPISDMPYGKTIYWRVRAKGDNGPSAWSEVRSLITPAPPTRPSLLSPASDALITDLTPRLDWSTSSLADANPFGYYQLQLATDEAFTVLVLDVEITNQYDSEYTLLTDLVPNTNYYWRVRALNSAGQYRSWSEVRNFREAMLAPVLTAPLYGETVSSLRPLFDWQDVVGADSYTIQVSKNSSMNRPFIKKTVADSEYLPTSDLPVGRTVYWRVRANGANGPSAWSEVWMLIGPSPPSLVSLSSPGNDSLVTDLTPRLDWSTSSLPTGTAFGYYQLQVATDDGFVGLVIDVQINDQFESEYNLVTDLQPNTKYYWRVRAFNAAGEYRSWSKVMSFREAILPPALEAPLDEETVGDPRPLFDWGDVDGADGYKIQVSKKSNMKYPFIKKTVAASEYLPTSDLPKNRVLYWRVKANGKNGPSEWSEVRSLIVFIP